MYPIDFFFRAAERHPDRVALDGPQGPVTYARLAADTRALAAALQDLDPEPQTRVAICAGNSARHILALLAVLASGKVWVPLNYRSTAREIGRILDATEPSIVIVDSVGAPLVPAGAAAHPEMRPEMNMSAAGPADMTMPDGCDLCGGDADAMNNVGCIAGCVAVAAILPAVPNSADADRRIAVAFAQAPVTDRHRSPDPNPPR